uniref:Uncharacterized protein n=1 Tax=Mesocestoides corti TaxID=53468 RepID=A0A5K3FUW1_MESCO
MVRIRPCRNGCANSYGRYPTYFYLVASVSTSIDEVPLKKHRPHYIALLLKLRATGKLKLHHPDTAFSNLVGRRIVCSFSLFFSSRLLSVYL